MPIQVAGIDELGCRVVGIPNGAVGEVLQMLPTGLPGFGPDPGGGGSPTTVALGFVAGVLTATVNGVGATINLRGTLAEDLAGTPLGYWLPLA